MTSKNPPWTDAYGLRDLLYADDWRTEDTYHSGEFSPIINGPAVYLFMMYEKDMWDRAMIAYVGMSANLKTRLSGHEVLINLRRSNHYIMRWFKRTNQPKLREKEKYYIKQFDPPWNVIGRPRGFDIS